MNAVVKTKDMTEGDYAKAKAEYIAFVEEKQRKQREYQREYARKKKMLKKSNECAVSV